MRTKLTIEDGSARELEHERPKPKRYRLRAASLGGVRPGVDLDKALALADSLADAELARKIDLRK